MPEKTTYFSKNLIMWYLSHKRNLPWRATKDPYHVWLSEIILQQTKVAQGLPYYKAFISAFPTVKELANASEEQVLKLWQGLGYYSRARNLHATASYVYFELGGVFPKSYQELLQLKGVGVYTASAIASICYDFPIAVVDGNVYRVLSRIFGISTPINSTQGVKEFKALAQQIMTVSNPGTYNQAIMEFGGQQCKPQNPNCEICIFNDSCFALQKKTVSKFPVKLKKNKVKKKHFNYLVIIWQSDTTLLQQRTGKGIWEKLYEFPLIESNEEITLVKLKNNAIYKELNKKYKFVSVVKYNEKITVHKLSHLHLYTRFWIVEASSKITNGISIDEINDFPVPTLIGNFIHDFF